MSKNELNYFKVLKIALQKKYQETHISCDLDITEWRQKEIHNFQDMMESIVNDKVSEKWFYTHIKNKNNTKLPRIDTLNLLSQFLGYSSWNDFINKNETNYFPNSQHRFRNLISTAKTKVKAISIAILVLVVAILVFNNIELLGQNKYSFCFVNADSGESLSGVDINVFILHKNQSAEMIKCDKVACFNYETNNKELSFAVEAAYYKKDTITRILNSSKKNEIIQLKPDDYAMMIHLFSSSKIEDWQRRRNQLDEMIAEDAMIYQLDYSESRGVEIYNKKEFINKMTMPINSLKNIVILENQYKNGKIAMMRFTQQKKEDLK